MSVVPDYARQSRANRLSCTTFRCDTTPPTSRDAPVTSAASAPKFDVPGYSRQCRSQRGHVTTEAHRPDGASVVRGIGLRETADTGGVDVAISATLSPTGGRTHHVRAAVTDVTYVNRGC